MTEPLLDRRAAMRRRLTAALAETAPGSDAEAGWAAYEGALIAGLCHEGAWEVALGAATTLGSGASGSRPPSTAPARPPSA